MFANYMFYQWHILIFWTSIIISNQALDVESMDMEIDLSNLGTVNTVFAALFRWFELEVFGFFFKETFF
jgi:hypothetical protein